MTRQDWLSQSIARVTRSPEETQSLGRELGALLVPGDIVALRGELGSGKTCLVKGLVAGQGMDQSVKSPTFTLMHRHQRPGREVWHVDAYRLKSSAEGEELGLDELVDHGAVICLEWPERVESWISRFPHFQISLTITGVNERNIVMTHVR